MDIINANVSTDLSETAIMEGLCILQSKNLNKVFLLTSNTYNFNLLYQICKALDFPYQNVDSSGVLSYDSWMLIDYIKNIIYYSKGA